MTTKKPKKPIYPGEPHKLDRAETSWFYTTEKGLLVVTEVRHPAGMYLGTGQTTIPWAKVEAALAVHRNVRRPARART